MTSTHIWGADGLVLRGGEIYLCDPLGNVAVRLDLTGTVLASDAYDAWGNLLACKDPQGNDYTLTGDPYGYKAQYGYYTDRETGLMLCTHRYYDPSTGRWLTRDPIGYEGGINLYQYCGNDPVNSIDNNGKSVRKAWGEFKNWYLGGMGGFSECVDNILFDGGVKRFGASYDETKEKLRYYANALVPDMVTCNVDVGSIVGIEVQFTLDRYGNVYWGWGPYIGYSIWAAPSVELCYYKGYEVFNDVERDEKVIKGFNTGWSYQFAANPLVPAAVIGAPETGFASALLAMVRVGFVWVPKYGAAYCIGTGVPIVTFSAIHSSYWFKIN